jgi:transcriptional regulator with PAS, ATPase and Fis domain
MQVAPTDISVLVTGESGTGKSTLARKIHQESRRQEKPFVYIDCTTIPANVFEAELFGYEAGAFTGAKKKGKIGKLAKADGGTVFLDEISEIPVKMQSKLLRFLQEQKFEKLGSTETQEVDVRIIAATNQNLEKLVEDNKFRQDLYYRLNVINVNLPPLRERMADIPCLVQEIMEEVSEELEIAPKKISEDGVKELIHYSWPGNIRELENFLMRVAISTEGKVIRKEDIISELTTGQTLGENKFNGSEVESKSSAIEDKEQELIRQKLKEYDNKTKVASELGISRQTLYNKLDKYDIQL